MERRTFIKNSTLTVISVSAFGVLNWNGKNFEGDTQLVFVCNEDL
jgi:hypothetical protein